VIYFEAPFDHLQLVNPEITLAPVAFRILRPHRSTRLRFNFLGEEICLACLSTSNSLQLLRHIDSQYRYLTLIRPRQCHKLPRCIKLYDLRRRTLWEYLCGSSEKSTKPWSCWSWCVVEVRDDGFWYLHV